MDTRERLLDLIGKKYDNRAEFERVAGLKPQTVNDWERKSESFYKCIPKLAKVLETTSNYLLCETDNPQVAPPQGEKHITNEKGNEKMRKPDEEIARKGLDAFFSARVQRYTPLSKNEKQKYHSVLNEDRTICDEAFKNCDIDKGKLLMFSRHEEIPTSAEFEKMLASVYPHNLKKYINGIPECVNLLKELRDCENNDEMSEQYSHGEKELINLYRELDEDRKKSAMGKIADLKIDMRKEKTFEEEAKEKLKTDA